MLTTILASLMLFYSDFNSDLRFLRLSTNKYDSLGNIELQKEYQKQLKIIKSKKRNIEDIDSLGIYLHTQLTSEVFPAWYGTVWITMALQTLQEKESLHADTLFQQLSNMSGSI